MKTSNKILLAASIVPFIIIFIMILSLKNILDNEPVVIQEPDRSKYETENYDLVSFEDIKVKGIWEIALKGGDSYKIELVTPPDTLKYTSVSKQDKKLFLVSDEKHFTIFKRPIITITLPSLFELNLAEGMYDININNLNLTKLNINIIGMASIIGTDSSVEELLFNGNGIVSADLSLMPVKNAYFNFNGVYMILLHMKGGELSGLLNGPGKLVAEGSISKNTVKTDGSYTVNHQSNSNGNTP